MYSSLSSNPPLNSPPQLPKIRHRSNSHPIDKSLILHIVPHLRRVRILKFECITRPGYTSGDDINRHRIVSQCECIIEYCCSNCTARICDRHRVQYWPIEGYLVTICIFGDIWYIYVVYVWFAFCFGLFQCNSITSKLFKTDRFRIQTMILIIVSQLIVHKNWSNHILIHTQCNNTSRPTACRNTAPIVLNRIFLKSGRQDHHRNAQS